jgi:hypothetical protein
VIFPRTQRLSFLLHNLEIRTFRLFLDLASSICRPRPFPLNSAPASIHSDTAYLGEKDRTMSSDREKEAAPAALAPMTPEAVEQEQEQPQPVASPKGYFRQIFESKWVELRGIQRVTPEEQEAHGKPNYSQILLLWISANLTANNIALGFLGPIVYGLSFTDAALCATFGGLIGSAGTGFMAMWGPVSGLRTMVRLVSGAEASRMLIVTIQTSARYTMGWWPSRICSLLNIVMYNTPIFIQPEAPTN